MELELYTAELKGDIIVADYALFSEDGAIANVCQQISMNAIHEFVNDGDLNVGEFINSDLDIDRMYFAAYEWIIDNMFRMVELYLNSQLGCAA